MVFLKKKNNIVSDRQNRGFSLVELIVVIAIVIIITSIILVNQNKFSSNILITNAAYRVALSMREAQVYGIGSKIEGTGLGRYGYGVNFTLTDPATDTFFFFKDIGTLSGTEYIYDYSYDPVLEWISDIKFSQGQKIMKLCVEGSAGKSCSSARDTYLNVVFIKPNLNAHFTTNIQGGTINKGFVVIQSPLGDKCRVIEIRESGSISVMPITSDDCSFIPS